MSEKLTVNIDLSKIKHDLTLKVSWGDQQYAGKMEDVTLQDFQWFVGELSDVLGGLK